MMKLISTTYGLSNEALDARSGAIAVNAYMAQLRALNRHEAPLLDMDFRKIEMLKKVLISAGEVDAPAAEGAMFASVQAPVSKRFEQVESALADALSNLDEPIEDAVKAGQKKAPVAA